MSKSLTGNSGEVQREVIPPSGSLSTSGPTVEQR